MQISLVAPLAPNLQFDHQHNNDNHDNYDFIHEITGYIEPIIIINQTTRPTYYSTANNKLIRNIH